MQSGNVLEAHIVEVVKHHIFKILFVATMGLMIYQTMLSSAILLHFFTHSNNTNNAKVVRLTIYCCYSAGFR
jgi:hypothetical protein